MKLKDQATIIELSNLR